jgi:5-methylcytosine-specific restriction protein A
MQKFNGTISSSSFTWVTETILMKRMDRSAFLHHGTHIPLAVLKFWGERQLEIGESRPILMRHGSTEYNMRLVREHMGRTRLFWHNDFSQVIGDRFPSCYSYLQNDIGIDDFPQMRFVKSTDELYTIELFEESQLSHDALIDEDEQQNEEIVAKDGRVIHYNGKRYERDPINRRRAIEIHGTTCFCCGFNFGQSYGAHGEGFIEIHHIKPLFIEGKEIIVDPKIDLIPLCSNCHRMIHRNQKLALDLAQLKTILKIE